MICLNTNVKNYQQTFLNLDFLVFFIFQKRFRLNPWDSSALDNIEFCMCVSKRYFRVMESFKLQATVPYKKLELYSFWESILIIWLMLKTKTSDIKQKHLLTRKKSSEDRTITFCDETVLYNLLNKQTF